MLETSDVGVVADDLTGACDVAACFASKVGSVGVCLLPDGKLSGGLTFQVINTQSRLEQPQTAGRILRRVGTWLAGKRIVFKKIDTGLRGPIGAELDGLLEGFGSLEMIGPALSHRLHRPSAGQAAGEYNMKTGFRLTRALYRKTRIHRRLPRTSVR